MMILTIFTDGGSRGNPGPAGIGFSAVKAEKEVQQQSTGAQVDELYFFQQAIGQATNNEAEYQAFIASLEWLLQQDFTDIEMIVWKLDSKLVVEQLNKNWKVKDARMREFAQQAWQLLDQLDVEYSILHVRRELNKRADELVNAALDL